MEEKEFQISPFLVFFLIHSVQVGVGVFGFQRTIMKNAGNDAWITVIAAGILVSMTIWVMYLLLNKHQKDLIQIHRDLFGKWIGGLLSLIWIIYWLMIGIIVLRSYIEIVQVWLFPMINMIMFSIILLLLVYYCVTGGFRIVTGISFLGVLIPFYIFFTFLYPIEYTHFRNLLPIWNHSIKDITISTKDMMLSYLGFSTLLIYYPYIKHPKKSQKWAHLGNLLTGVIYLFILIISIGFFSENQISRHTWATLSLWKIVELPFVERFEYIGITSWVLIILPNICLSVWASTKGVQTIFNIKPQKVVVVSVIILLIVLGSTVVIEGRENIEKLNKYMSLLGLWLVFVYIPILTLLSFLLSKIRRRNIEKA
ncbi:GerAB/ArcD/ProY family transporter [Bacillus sp. ISL-47]|uniref:GerAB/ArcD/ProY family transporter n=1 Tax=Bacillus sp. ISL-47 TaxID=2819130 RepID=UPI001BE7507A|nr:GerAB/ArcD/ProY family transporter [Bacillus sp. ISL-47]MBT2686857.1 GerAB/ArcD/ProY family transporter [Bacillus sp. ISL-47]MBT2706788.1 GerAB/ArcD/ProY family transporter [Pseudomonas sp. ISL-84]